MREHYVLAFLVCLTRAPYSLGFVPEYLFFEILFELETLG